jgi:hypothetical protein
VPEDQKIAAFGSSYMGLMNTCRSCRRLLFFVPEDQEIATFGSSYMGLMNTCRSCRRLRSFDLAFQMLMRLGTTTSADLCCNPTLSLQASFMPNGFLYILLMIALPATAQIYRYTDATGTTAYSNQPPAGTSAEAIELPPLNTVASPPPGACAPTDTRPRNEPSRAAYEVLELAGLPTNQALRANDGNFTVNVLLKPRLEEGHLLRLLLDDQPYGEPSNIPALQLLNIDRGEHRLAVQVMDGQNIVQQSATLIFTVQRVHKR